MIFLYNLNCHSSTWCWFSRYNIKVTLGAIHTVFLAMYWNVFLWTVSRRLIHGNFHPDKNNFLLLDLEWFVGLRHVALTFSIAEEKVHFHFSSYSGCTDWMRWESKWKLFSSSLPYCSLELKIFPHAYRKNGWKWKIIFRFSYVVTLNEVKRKIFCLCGKRIFSHQSLPLNNKYLIFFWYIPPQCEGKTVEKREDRKWLL